MRKTLLTKLALLLVMLVGAGSAWAADKWVKTAPADLATGDIVVIVDQTSSKAMSNNNQTSAPSAIGVTLTNDEISGDVAATLQWEVNVSGSGDSKTFQFIADNGYLTVKNTNNGVRVDDGDRNTFTIVTGGDKNGYYLFNVSGTDNRYVGCYNSSDWRCYTSINNNIKGNNNAFYKKVSVSGPVDPSVTISSNTIAVGTTATISGPDGLEISFSSDDVTVATVNSAGVVTGVAAGTASITATWNAVANTYNGGSKDFEVTVIAATTFEKVTDASQLVAGNEYIIVDPENSKAMGVQNSSYRNSVDVKISSDKVSITDEAVAVLTLGGSTDAWTFLASDNSKYLSLTSSSNAIHASDEATASGATWTITNDFKLQNNEYSSRVLKYNSGSPRFACYESGQKDAFLYVMSGSVTSVATTTTIDATGITNTDVYVGTAAGSLSAAVTVTEGGDAVSGATVTWSSSNTSVATIASDGTVTLVAAGTTTITASYAGVAGEYKSSSDTYELTVTSSKPVFDYATLPFTFDGGRSAIENTDGLTHSGLGSDYSSSPKLKFDGTGDYLILKINENPGILTFDIQGNSFSGGTFTVQTSEDGETYSDLKKYTNLGTTQTDNYVLPSSTRYIKWIYTNKSSGNVGIGNIKLSKEVKVTSNGWATYIAPCKMEFEAGNAYIVTAASVDEGLTIKEVTKVNTNDPILLKGEGAKSITILAKATEVANNDNLLTISDGNIESGKYAYVLAKEGTGAAFKQWTGEKQVLNGRVVLLLDESVAAARSFFMLDDETTGIASVKVSQSTEQVFDLQGRRVAQPTKGLYIVNGKKMILK